MPPLRVMIVEDSATVREFLARAINSDPRLTLVAQCATAEQALERLDRVRPDVISMDVHLPGMSGLDATRRIMERRPTPIVIISRSINAQELDATMEALRAGAASAIEKPACRTADEAAAMSARICRELVLMSEVKVVRQRFNAVRPRAASQPSVPLACELSALPASAAAPPRLLGMVASTGGPHAVETVLVALGADFPLPIALVQHMTPSFHDGFVAWLARIAPQQVTQAEHGEPMRPGHVYVAPADQHLAVRGDRLALARTPLVSGQRPSGTVLLESMAQSLGSRAVGLVLTGMGDDGAHGLLAMHRAGAITIAEHASTTVVNGMPEAARQLGAVGTSLPLPAIGPAILSCLPALAEVSA